MTATAPAERATNERIELARYTIADLVAARPNVRNLLGIDMLAERRAPAA